jgi:hypothetical protein
MVPTVTAKLVLFLTGGLVLFFLEPVEVLVHLVIQSSVLLVVELVMKYWL